MNRELIYRLLPLILLVVWHVAAEVISSPYIPSPVSVALSLVRLTLVGDPNGYSLLLHMAASSYRVLLGLAAAITSGVILGIAMGLNKTAMLVLSPIIEALRPVPPIAWIPIVIFAFGSGLKSHVIMVWIASFFPILTSCVDGVKGIDHVYYDTAKLLNLKGLRFVRLVVLPGALPSILTGLKVSVGVGWMVIIASEMVGVRKPLGLGFLALYMKDLGLMPELLATVVAIGLSAKLMSFAVRLVEKRILAWRRAPSS